MRSYNRVFEGFGDLRDYYRRETEGATDAGTDKSKEPTTDSGGDKGASDGKDNGPLTQAQVNAIIANERRAWEKKLQASEKARKDEATRLTALSEEFEQFKGWLKEVAEGEEPEGDKTAVAAASDTGDPELDAVLKELTPPPGVKDKELYTLVKRRELSDRRKLVDLTETMKNQSKQISELLESVATERKAREGADKARLDAIRDTEIAKALTDNRCVDIAAGIKLMRDNVFLDQKLGKFRYKQQNNEVVSVAEGIAAELPKYMIQPATDGGGSGSAGSRVSTGTPTDSEISALEKEFLASQQRASQTGRDADIARYRTIKKKLEAAKKAKGL